MAKAEVPNTLLINSRYLVGHVFESIAKKNGTLHTKEHKKRMAALKREEQQILDVQKARSGKHKSKGDSAFRTADASGQEGVAGTLGEMEGMGAKDSWAKASEGFKDYKAKHTKGMTEFKKGDVAFLPSSGSICFFINDAVFGKPMTPIGKLGENIDALKDVKSGDVLCLYEDTD